MTVHNALLYGEQILLDTGVAQPRWNSERILMLAVQHPRSKIYTELHRELTSDELSRFQALLKRRAAHYPLAYLEQAQEFYGRQFFVEESVLIPRPETEEIIHAVLSLPLTERQRILDLGSGSGNVAVTLALEVPGSYVVALEISHEANVVIRKNLKGNVNLIRGDFSTIPFQSNAFDIITANLPYVEQHEFRDLPAETSWEPKGALVVDSLEETYANVMTQAVRILNDGGCLVMEFGAGQSERLENVLASISGLRLIQIRKDFRGIPRVLVIRKDSLTGV